MNPETSKIDPETLLLMIRTTAERTGFDARLVEKDYYCSLLLQGLNVEKNSLIFKGGTCISKVFSDFYRLSEDLDFCISIAPSDTRTVRRKKIDPFKRSVAGLPENVSGVRILEALTGRNVSTQYVALIGYASVISGREETVKLEIGVREPLMLPFESRLALTLLKDPFSGKEVLPPFPITVINEQEAWAEKTRAALARLAPAIRDFFDLDYAIRNKKAAIENEEFLALVQRKIAVPGTGPVNLSKERREELVRQVSTELRPVLRGRDFEKFNLDRVWETLTALAEKLHG
ncbi:MAG: nucleotidyl transferase AbiEii/AbiGii toxin family protein [Candidatus Omnitrophota bacterium]